MDINKLYFDQLDINILELVANGFSNTDIGLKLFISPHTVKSRLTKICTILNAKDRTHAACIAIRLQIID